MSRQSIVLVEVRCELGAGTRGASLGVDAIRTAAINTGSDLFADIEKVEITADHDLLHFPSDTVHAKNIEGIVQVHSDISKAIKTIVSEGNTPIVLAGDHSTASGTVSGLKAADPTKKVGVIWIDAHADLHSPYTSPSGNVHGMPLAALLGTDNISHQRNNPSRKTVECWKELKIMGGSSAKVQPNDLIFVAVRDTEPAEEALIDDWSIKNFSVEALRNKGAAKLGTDILELLSDCDLIYVSFDVDSMDSTLVSSGTGTPVENGLYAQEAKELMITLASSDKVKCIEIVEVNPLLDDKNTMGEVAFDILEATLGAIAKSE